MLQKRSVSHMVPGANGGANREAKLDVRDLDTILEIDPATRTCVAEAGATFVDVVSATMRYGLVPIVVPELKTITVGGAVSGCSLESMSFRFGGFHDTCLEYEVVTAKGEVLVCTPENDNKLVFQMMHGTFGTLGILTKLKFRLVPAKPFVNVSYETYDQLEEYLRAIWTHYRRGDADFMDGIIHSPTEHVLSLGRFADAAPYANRYDWTKVYYRSTRERDEDYLRTADYLFRYDRGVTNVHPKTLVGRFLFGRLIGSSELLRLANGLRRVRHTEVIPFTLDVFLPFSKVTAFMQWYRSEFDFFPLWVVPYKRVRDYEWLSPEFYAHSNDELFVDLAIYGMERRDGKNYHRLMEQKLLELGGVKTLISTNLYSEEEFWSTWNRRNYETVKARTDPDNAFSDLYSKMCKRAGSTRGMP